MIKLKNLLEGKWADIMSKVRNEQGPFTLVVYKGSKVLAQKDFTSAERDLIPAHYETFLKEYPTANFHIEDNGGQVIWKK